jgi:hypothetical protein
METQRHPCPERIRTHEPSNQSAKTYALDYAATGIGTDVVTCYKLTNLW